MYLYLIQCSVPWGQCMSSRTMHSKHPQLWHSSLPLPHQCLQLPQHSDQAPRLCNGCGKLPQSQGHCIDDTSKNKDFDSSYVMATKNVGLTVKYKSLVTGSVVALKAQVTNSSNSAWSEKIGARALLYFWHLSRHLMPSVSVSNRILALSDLKIESKAMFCVKYV